MTGGDRLLGDHRDLGRELGEAREDHRLGGLVGDGDGRGVGLGPHRHVLSIVLEDDLAGALGERDDLGQKVGVIH